MSSVLIVGHSKSMFAWNFQFLTPPALSLFVLRVTSPSSTYVRFSELTPLSKNFRDAYKFSNEKSRIEKRENN